MEFKNRRMLVVVSGLLWGLCSSFSAVASSLEIDSDCTDHTRVAVSLGAVSEFLASPDTEVRRATPDEVIAEANARGDRAMASGAYSRPWFIVKVGIGMPNLVSAHLEVFVADNISVEVGAGAGLLPSVYEASIRWRPEATCFGCHGKNFFSIGFGIDPGVYGTPNHTGVVILGTVDATYIHRFAEHFGFFVSTKAGIGVGKEFGNTSEDWSSRVEPTIKLELLNIGLAI